MNNRPLEFKHIILIPLYTIALLWGIHLLAQIFPLQQMGIGPREVSSLPYIVLSPFLHVNRYHLIANSVTIATVVPFFVFLENRRVLPLTLWFILFSGLGTWLIGRGNSIHIGASGVLYAIMGYLFTAGIFRKSIKALLISLLTFFLYGGTLLGILPLQAQVSWEGHLSGLVTGIYFAWRNTR